MRTSIEQSWIAQRRQLAAGLLTGVALISAVVVSRRVAGDASAFASQFWPTILGMVGIVAALFSVTVPGILDNLSAAQRFLATSLCGIPGLILGLSLMPTGSGAGLTSLLAFYALALWVSHLANLDAFSQVSLRIGQTRLIRDVSTSPLDTQNVAAESSAAVASMESDRQSSDRPPSESSSLATVQNDECVEQSSQPDHADFDSILSIEADLETRLAQLSSENMESLEVDHEETSLPHPSQNPNTQQWSSRTVEGNCEQLEGVITATLAVNEERIAIHIPFAPALDAIPEFECEAINGEPVEVCVTQTKSYGMRLELKRPKSEAQTRLVVQVGYFASLEIAEVILDPQRVSA